MGIEWSMALMLKPGKKKKFDKFSVRGIVYSCLAIAGMSYELFFREPVRIFLILGYSVVLFVGIVCLLFLEE
jgi:hypothetical protein